MSQRVEWNAEHYHVVSRPHEVWGARVLDRVPHEGIRVAIDSGCGTGKITRELLDRLPEATIYALDVSPQMLAVAERELAEYGDRVRFRQTDLGSISPEDVGETADLIFSTATFHWVKDHDLLFRDLFTLLNPGGWLIAQCGGGPNIATLRRRMAALMKEPRFAPHFAGWADPWYFATAEETADRLHAAGFGDVQTNVEPHPAPMADADEYRSFITTVVIRDQLARLPDQELKDAFANALTDLAATDTPPYELDYHRLNIHARRSMD
jgi:trans-aconitate methyltransferase